MKKLKIKKNEIHFLEHREVIRPCTKNINLRTFYRLSFKLKKYGKKRLRLLDVILKKIEKYFFIASGGAGEFKLRSFDSESKITSDCSNSFFAKKITHNSYFSFNHFNLELWTSPLKKSNS